MTESDSEFAMPVAVTGASGYLGSWVVRQLLDRGATVHATVRDPTRADRTDHLQRLADDSPGTLKLFAADLMQDGSFDQAFTGCGTVMHTASPFSIQVKDPQAELVDPAVQGTRNVLETVSRRTTISRVVLTSSVVAVLGDASDVPDGGTVDESHWNNTSSLTYQPYSFSKTVAEREAWAIAEAQERWSLVTINPGFILGPSLTPRNDSTSIDFVVKLMDGSRRTGLPRLSSAMVDVRDVAQAHVQAALRPQASGRHLLVADSAWYMDTAGWLRDAFPDRPLPRRALPDALTYLVGPILAGFSWRYLRANLGRTVHWDNHKSREALGIEYRPLPETLRDHGQQVLHDGLVG